MSFPHPASRHSLLIPVKHKIFVSYHHGNDQSWYDILSRTFDDQYDIISDNSLDRRIDSTDAEYVMRRIREKYITGSSCTIVLIGEYTWGRKYVDWEISATIEKEHGLIGVRLPTAPVGADAKVTVPGRLYDNIQSGYAVWTSWANLTSGIDEFRAHPGSSDSR
ncbi:TIR domain-containing protein [Elioraea sp.]|uniref:TIR domain-containing protein n=1 Tax=Elioraea sp. TaxID=2185103 RepID=UPI003F6ED896